MQAVALRTRIRRLLPPSSATPQALTALLKAKIQPQKNLLADQGTAPPLDTPAWIWA